MTKNTPGKIRIISFLLLYAFVFKLSKMRISQIIKGETGKIVHSTQKYMINI